MDDDDDLFSKESMMWQNIEQGQDGELDDVDCYEVAYNLTGVSACLYTVFVLFEARCRWAA